MSSILSKAKIGSACLRPPAAVEITSEGVVAAAVRSPGQPPVYSWRALPAGAVVADAAEPNLRDAAAVSTAIRAALDELAPRGRAVTLVIPDRAVRVFVLDFDTLPTKPAEALPVIRFRLRKMVPFEVEHAAVSYQVLTRKEAECRVMTAVAPGPILQEYESVVQAAGYETGAVLPAMLASLASIHDGAALTTAIAIGDNLLLYRTLNLPEDPEQKLAEARRDIAVAMAYFEDQLRVRPTQLLYSGSGGAERFGRWLNDPELTVAALVERPKTGALSPLGEACVAGVTGALAEAR
jgi:type IV pilus assembly protein PilM